MTSVADIVAAYEAGQNKYSYWRKVPSQTTGAGVWFDLSMSTGNPLPNYYIGSPATATALARSTDGGLDHGPNVSPANKYFHRFMLMNQTATAVPLPFIVCDYLMFYPFISQDAGDVALTTSIDLPRYPTGAGVQMMAVVTNSQAGGVTFNVTYTNQDGTAGRVTPNITTTTQSVAGTLISTAQATAGCVGPFLPLQAGDTGVQSVQTVTWNASDVGLMTLVLVKPMLTGHLFDITAPVEIMPIIDRAHPPPPIIDDAYLNIVCCPNGTLASTAFNGELETVWSE